MDVKYLTLGSRHMKNSGAAALRVQAYQTLRRALGKARSGSNPTIAERDLAHEIGFSRSPFR
jgi:DNA-binding GntR family transcriptional regulator